MSSTQLVDFVMGTAVTIDVCDDSTSIDALLTEAMARLKAIDMRFSTYKADSEVSRYGRGELDDSEISADLRNIMELCEKFNAASNGYFDINAAAQLEPAASLQHSTKPNAEPIEPSGAVKGWAIQQAVDILVAGGLHNFCVNIGGDVYASGHNGGGAAWRIGLQHPADKAKVMAVLEVSNCAVATSGFYERGQHIVKLGEPRTNELTSVTIVGPDITMADAYATAALAMGAKGLGWASELTGFEIFAVDSDQITHRSPGMDEFLVN